MATALEKRLKENGWYADNINDLKKIEYNLSSPVIQYYQLIIHRTDRKTFDFTSTTEIAHFAE